MGRSSVQEITQWHFKGGVTFCMSHNPVYDLPVSKCAEDLLDVSEEDKGIGYVQDAHACPCDGRIWISG